MSIDVIYYGNLFSPANSSNWHSPRGANCDENGYRNKRGIGSSTRFSDEIGGEWIVSRRSIFHFQWHVHKFVYKFSSALNETLLIDPVKIETRPKRERSQWIVRIWIYLGDTIFCSFITSIYITSFIVPMKLGKIRTIRYRPAQ